MTQVLSLSISAAIRAALPNLHTLAVQNTLRLRTLCLSGFPAWYGFDLEGEWRNFWFVVELGDFFKGRTKVVLEAWKALRAGHSLRGDGKDEMVRARGVVDSCRCQENREYTSEMVAEATLGGRE
jgi:hypothetical protein